MAASEELLGLLHDAVAQDLIRRLQSGEATAAEISAAIKFLKDNGIEAVATEDSALKDLSESLPQFTDEEGLHRAH
jgi:ABC-type Zn uptake system ZnuABC Zn-binding protein ZnuA